MMQLTRHGMLLLLLLLLLLRVVVALAITKNNGKQSRWVSDIVLVCLFVVADEPSRQQLISLASGVRTMVSRLSSEDEIVRQRCAGVIQFSSDTGTKHKRFCCGLLSFSVSLLWIYLSAVSFETYRCLFCQISDERRGCVGTLFRRCVHSRPAPTKPPAVLGWMHWQPWLWKVRVSRAVFCLDCFCTGTDICLFGVDAGASAMRASQLIKTLVGLLSAQTETLLRSAAACLMNVVQHGTCAFILYT
jgi:hypothetical protein